VVELLELERLPHKGLAGCFVAVAVPAETCVGPGREEGGAGERGSSSSRGSRSSSSSSWVSIDASSGTPQLWCSMGELVEGGGTAGGHGKYPQRVTDSTGQEASTSEICGALFQETSGLFQAWWHRVREQLTCIRCCRQPGAVRGHSQGMAPHQRCRGQRGIG
jgi:hypothetical protein